MKAQISQIFGIMYLILFLYFLQRYTNISICSYLPEHETGCEY